MPEANDAAIGALPGPPRVHRRDALALLGRTDPAEVFRLVRALLPQAGVDLRGALAHRLGELDQFPEAAPLLLDMLSREKTRSPRRPRACRARAVLAKAEQLESPERLAWTHAALYELAGELMSDTLGHSRSQQLALPTEAAAGLERILAAGRDCCANARVAWRAAQIAMRRFESAGISFNISEYVTPHRYPQALHSRIAGGAKEPVGAKAAARRTSRDSRAQHLIHLDPTPRGSLLEPGVAQTSALVLTT